MRSWAAIGLALVLSPITALLSAKTMHTLWGWFVARDYGDGPSLAAWFGLSEIATIVLSGALLHVARKEADKDANPFMQVIGQSIGMWFGFALILGFAWVTGFALHWV